MRLQGTRQECQAAAERIGEVLTVLEQSPLYPNRPPSQLVRLYLEVNVREQATKAGQR